MYVVIIKLKIRFVISFSLKDKRMRLRRLKDKFMVRFKVPLTEVELQDNKNFTILGFSFVSGDKKTAENISGNMMNFINEICEDDIIEIENYLEKF